MAKKQKTTRRKPWVDPDDAPEWTDEMMARAEIRKGDTIIRPGSPPLEAGGRRAQTPKSIRSSPVAPK